jgi:hypothetical protein
VNPPKSPAGRPARSKALKSCPPPPELTPAEIRWVTAYRMMDQEAKDDHMRFAESTARAHPMRSTSAHPGAHGIRLATAFGKEVRA